MKMYEEPGHNTMCTLMFSSWILGLATQSFYTLAYHMHSEKRLMRPAVRGIAMRLPYAIGTDPVWRLLSIPSIHGP